MNSDQRAARGIAAKTLLNDQTLQDGWADIEADLMREWENSLPWQKRKRELIHGQIKTMKKLRAKLASYAGNIRD